jgi:hypothetical protein
MYALINQDEIIDILAGIISKYDEVINSIKISFIKKIDKVGKDFELKLNKGQIYDKLCFRPTFDKILTNYEKNKLFLECDPNKGENHLKTKYLGKISLEEQISNLSNVGIKLINELIDNSTNEVKSHINNTIVRLVKLSKQTNQ